jgi:hypothetical protein
MASMSRALNFTFGSELRSARARASRSAGKIRAGSSTASRHTMASLFRLRRWASAEPLRRSYTSSGTFLSVKLVGMAGLNFLYGTTMVPIRNHVNLSHNNPLQR